MIPSTQGREGETECSVLLHLGQLGVEDYWNPNRFQIEIVGLATYA